MTEKLVILNMNKDIINKLLSNISVNLMTLRFSAFDAEYEYILDGIEFRCIDMFQGEEHWEMHVFDVQIARFFAYDFVANANPVEEKEALHLNNLKVKLIEIFQQADQKGYDDFFQKVEQKIKPFQNTDSRVAQAIWKIFQQSISKEDDETFYLDNDLTYWRGYKNGLVRKAAEVIREHPDMFIQYPGLLIKHKAIDQSKAYYFIDVFWSPAAYREALEVLASNFLSADGQSWIYKERGNKTAFIALFEELYVKDYLKKRLTNQEIRNVALNSFNLEISERTFNEGAAIIRGRRLFKSLPIHIRFIGDEDLNRKVYKRR